MQTCAAELFAIIATGVLKAWHAQDVALGAVPIG